LAPVAEADEDEEEEAELEPLELPHEHAAALAPSPSSLHSKFWRRRNKLELNFRFCWVSKN